jgi:hypothetical protein
MAKPKQQRAWNFIHALCCFGFLSAKKAFYVIGDEQEQIECRL